LRFNNRQVLMETDAVLQVIYGMVSGFLPGSPHPGPLPGGEGIKAPYPSPGGRRNKSAVNPSSLPEGEGIELCLRPDLSRGRGFGWHFSVQRYLPLPPGEGRGEGGELEQFFTRSKIST